MPEQAEELIMGFIPGYILSSGVNKYGLNMVSVKEYEEQGEFYEG